jgi:polyribonucleotide nucleotidyltransferase
MGKRYSKEEKLLMMAGLAYAEETGMSKTKIAWGLSSIMGRTDSSVYSQLCAMDNEIPKGVWKLLDLHDTEEVQEFEEDLVVKDDYLEQKIGEIVKVRVVSVRTFGALCAVEDTTRTLLLHLSEIADEYIDDVSMYLEEGDEFLAMLIMNKVTNRLALSTKRVGTVKRKRPKVGEYA